jgi:Tfp pilus assembly protein PilF
MPSPRIESLEKLVGTPRDGALLRYALGTAYLEAGDLARASAALAEAVARDPLYSAAWKILGQAHARAGRNAEALGAWQRGIEAARQRGDKQAEKEMTVFLRKLDKQRGA